MRRPGRASSCQLGGVAVQTARDAGHATYRMRLSVRRRIHWGIGRFCFIFFARKSFVRRDLCDGMVAVCDCDRREKRVAWAQRG